MKTVAIVDYKLGNLFSVYQACIAVGLRPLITDSKTEIENADGVILPGVGSFREAMNNLHALNLIDPLIKVLEDNKFFMGVCLGFQLLFSKSYEFGTTKGLGYLQGEVKKFGNGLYHGRNIKVPQVGWNSILPFSNNQWKNSLLCDNVINEYMYFVHSYYVETDDKRVILSTTNYEGFSYCSSIQINNIFASQFHPEKSGVAGLKVYKKFAQNIMSK